MTVDETYSAGKQRCERGDTNPESNLVGQPPDVWKRSTRAKDSFDEKATLLMRATTSRSNDHLQGPKRSMRTEVTPGEKATLLMGQRPAGQTTVQRPKAVCVNGSNPRRESNIVDGATTSWSNNRPQRPKAVYTNGSNPRQESNVVDGAMTSRSNNHPQRLKAVYMNGRYPRRESNAIDGAISPRSHDNQLVKPPSMGTESGQREWRLPPARKQRR